MRGMKIETYRIRNADQDDTPFVAVYIEHVKQNIATLNDLFSDQSRIRPHVKTHKCQQIVKLLLDSGITKFKCSTIAEAEMLALAGAVDIMLAYQPVGKKVDRFLNLMKTYPLCSFSCLVDNESSAEILACSATNASLKMSVWIDLNNGMNRTGVPPGEDGLELFRLCSRLRGLDVIGLHCYDGHLTDQDANLRLKKAETEFRKVEEFARSLINIGFAYPRIVAGSTPTIEFYAQRQNVECSPGTFIYWDAHYKTQYPELKFKNAALVVSRVISKPTPTTICLDLGYKAISSEGPLNERVNFFDLNSPDALLHSEEHLLISLDNSTPEVGAIIYGIPYHIGRTINLYDKCAVVEDELITEHWDHTARSRSITL
jgi:D-serine deaminase-like pyridoxal phosphate-dependent protein